MDNLSPRYKCRLNRRPSTVARLPDGAQPADNGRKDLWNKQIGFKSVVKDGRRDRA